MANEMDADQGKATLQDLYERWERDFWSAREIDFSEDKRDWLRLTDEERRHWYWLGGFSTYLQIEPDAVKYLSLLVPMLNTPRQQTALGLQIADEGRHSYFFQRYYDEVLSTALPVFDDKQATSSAPYRFLVFDGPAAAIDAAVQQRTDAALAGAIVHAFIVLEGTLGLASFSTIRLLLSRLKLFPGLLAGLTKAHQDEVRHAQLGVALLQDLLSRNPDVRNAIVAKVDELLPALSDVLRPQPLRVGAPDINRCQSVGAS